LLVKDTRAGLNSILDEGVIVLMVAALIENVRPWWVMLIRSVLLATSIQMVF
jgi:hypothetical protein